MTASQRGSCTEKSTHWFEHCAAPQPDARHRKACWKALRQGVDLSELDLFRETSRSWETKDQTGTIENGALKFGLQSIEHHDRCEMVVLFPKGTRATVCVSSQIGCGVGCIFCATGTMGYRRNLSDTEMLEQVYLARWIASQRGRHLRNVVFMGMGEPLHNFDALVSTLEWLIDSRGFGISPKQITVSTSGCPSAMLEIARIYPAVRLALSLHSASSEQRRWLMPRSSNDLDRLRATIQELNSIQIGPVWIEYVLMGGVNDGSEDATQLLSFLRGLRVEVNLIPLNPIGTTGWGASELVPSDVANQRAFAHRLREAGIRTTIRNSFGLNESAACGQLVSR
jgi:23S rRNA (adenine2503-C2)-methyltransferase